jgi:hypothetical protein
MKMLKNFSIVLLLSGSFGVQAEEVGRLDFSNPEHFVTHRDMYENDGMNMSSIKLKEEYQPKNLERTLAAQKAAQEAVRRAQEIEENRLSAQASAEGISVDALRAELKRAQVPSRYLHDIDGNPITPTLDEVLSDREEATRQKQKVEVLAQEKAAEDALFARETDFGLHRERFEDDGINMSSIMLKDEYNRVNFKETLKKEREAKEAVVSLNRRVDALARRQGKTVQDLKNDYSTYLINADHYGVEPIGFEEFITEREKNNR